MDSFQKETISLEESHDGYDFEFQRTTYKDSEGNLVAVDLRGKAFTGSVPGETLRKLTHPDHVKLGKDPAYGSSKSHGGVYTFRRVFADRPGLAAEIVGAGEAQKGFSFSKTSGGMVELFKDLIRSVRKESAGFSSFMGPSVVSGNIAVGPGSSSRTITDAPAGGIPAFEGKLDDGGQSGYNEWETDSGEFNKTSEKASDKASDKASAKASDKASDKANDEGFSDDI